jgi:dihydroorotate dehydrogenase electron transfer subunit
MGCGMGGCYSCVIPVRDAAGGQHYVRSCIGGPVFAGADLVWD